MKKILILNGYFLMTFFFVMPQPVYAQIIIPEIDSPANQQIFVQMGLEPEWVTTLGYRQLVEKSESKTNFYLGGSVKFAPLIVSKGGWRLNFTQAIDRQFSTTCKVVISNDIYLAHNHNRAGTMDGLGFDLQGAMLHSGEKWSKGLEVGWQHTAFTHIKHSKATKDTFDERYPDNTGRGPVDGWYKNTANRFRVGFLAGKNIGDHLAFQLGIGSVVSLQKQGVLLSFAHGQVPFYVNGQLNYAW